MMIFNKNKTKLQQKAKENHETESSNTKNSLKAEIMKSLLKRKAKEDNSPNKIKNFSIIEEKARKIKDSIDTDKIYALIKKIYSSFPKLDNCSLRTSSVDEIILLVSCSETIETL